MNFQGTTLILVKKILEIERDCELKEFIVDLKLTFQMGAAFTRAEEDVNSNKEVILMDKVLYIKLLLYELSS